MRNRSIGVASVLLASCTAVVGADDRDDGPAYSVAPHVQYFGWFCDSCRGVGSRDYMADIADHSNYSMIFHNEDGAGERTKLDSARGLGMKGILAVSSVFGSHQQAWLHPDWRQRWAQYAANIAPNIGDVLAFHLADEPELGSFYGVVPGLPYTPWDQIKGQLEEATQLIHDTFPGVPVIMNFSNYGATAGLPPPANADWVGFFCYGWFDNCQATGASVPEALDRVKQASQPHQRFYLIPEASSWWYDAVGIPVEVAAMEANVQRYADLASSEPRVIALMTFIRQSVTNDHEHMYGAEAYPGVAARFRDLGLTITGRAPGGGGGGGGDGKVTGTIDGIYVIDGQPMLQGWACGRGVDASIWVHLYVGGPAGVGQIVDGYLANAPSEGAIAAACEANGSRYRFFIPMTPLHDAHAGQSIYVHGISPTGLSNDLLGGSGQLVVP